MKRRPVLLAQRLRPESYLLPLVEVGLGAMAPKDRALIETSQRDSVGDSLDLDAATANEYPNANRWDYLVSVTTTSHLVAIEPHSATTSEVSVVIAKKRAALAYLRTQLIDGVSVARWLWVTHGAVAIAPMDKARRRLAENGIEFCGRRIRSLT